MADLDAPSLVGHSLSGLAVLFVAEPDVREHGTAIASSPSRSL